MAKGKNIRALCNISIIAYLIIKCHFIANAISLGFKSVKIILHKRKLTHTHIQVVGCSIRIVFVSAIANP